MAVKKGNIFVNILLLKILCAYYCHLYIQLCACFTKIYVSEALVDTAPELCQKNVIFFLLKGWKAFLFMLWNICLLLLV